MQKQRGVWMGAGGGNCLTGHMPKLQALQGKERKEMRALKTFLTILAVAGAVLVLGFVGGLDNGKDFTVCTIGAIVSLVIFCGGAAGAVALGNEIEYRQKNHRDKRNKII